MREAVARAEPVVLEPVSVVEVTVPDDLQGEVLGDINARRGRVQGSVATADDHHLVTASVPAAELRRYAIDLRSLTGGRGSFRARPDRYEVMPPTLADRATASVGG
jgi:elongation factor G